MLETFKTLTTHQLEAALQTLCVCVERCPADAWERPVAHLRFCQVAFHTVFFTDHHLEPTPAGFRDQPFHRAHRALFRDYEELEDREQRLMYTRPDVLAYAEHCVAKTRRVIAQETADSLQGPSGLERRTFSRAELYVYTIRHVQHHAAALGLHLRTGFGIDLPWFASGWTHHEQGR